LAKLYEHLNQVSEDGSCTTKKAPGMRLSSRKSQQSSITELGISKHSRTKHTMHPYVKPRLVRTLAFTTTNRSDIFHFFLHQTIGVTITCIRHGNTREFEGLLNVLNEAHILRSNFQQSIISQE
jgi:hypothetical protein